MKRREFLKLTAYTAVAASVPIALFASGQKTDWDAIAKAGKLMDANSVPEPYYAVVHPETIKELMTRGLLSGEHGVYEGFTWVESHALS